MLHNSGKLNCILASALAAFLVVGQVWAEKPEWAGEGKGKGKSEGRGHRDREDERDRDEHGKKHFDDGRHRAIHDYYDREHREGRCPPGLAKKHNGCMPPGQARKWAVGKPLPPDVVRYDLPQPLVVQIGPPPPGTRYVRVASDILIIAVGTGMVVDAIKDLGRK